MPEFSSMSPASTLLPGVAASPETGLPKTVIVVGAGPAGLTAAAELQSSGFSVTVLEKDSVYVGGISRTVHYKGFRFDIGGHRFFSKSSEVMEWWAKRLPQDFIQVNRLSRIFYRGKFFDYPLKARNALFNLGILTSLLCVLSYVWARIFPIRPEKSFSDWVTNRFGRKLFSIFFRTYTEKVWGMPCDQISADWAAQRIKNLSLLSAIVNALIPRRRSGSGSAVIKTLIDKFQYPRFGPGMMWEKTRDDIRAGGGQVLMGLEVISVQHEADRVVSVVTQDGRGNRQVWTGDSFIVSMPLRELVQALSPGVPAARHAGDQLQYRDFLTVALMIRRVGMFPDNWIYVHDPEVKLGRIQNFNNWSPEMVPGNDITCLGLEYFCFEGDGLWTMSDAALCELGKTELAKLGLVDPSDVVDGCVIRQAKAYPVYGPGYRECVEAVRTGIEPLKNLQVIGRNGMHKYNNQDHSMMTALLAARNLKGAHWNLWQVNSDAEYHEESSSKDTSGRLVPESIKD